MMRKDMQQSPCQPFLAYSLHPDDTVHHWYLTRIPSGCKGPCGDSFAIARKRAALDDGSAFGARIAGAGPRIVNSFGAFACGVDERGRRVHGAEPAAAGCCFDPDELRLQPAIFLCAPPPKMPQRVSTSGAMTETPIQLLASGPGAHDGKLVLLGA